MFLFGRFLLGLCIFWLDPQIDLFFVQIYVLLNRSQKREIEEKKKPWLLRVQLFIIFICKIIGFFMLITKFLQVESHFLYSPLLFFFLIFNFIIISLLIYIFITQYFSTVCGPHTLTQRRLFFFFSRTTTGLGGQTCEIGLPLPFPFFSLE